MGKSNNQPDWEDVLAYVAALELHSGGDVTVEFIPVRQNGRHCFNAVAYLQLPRPSGASNAPLLRADGTWPGSGYARMESLVYHLLIKLDHEVARHWVQYEM